MLSRLFRSRSKDSYDFANSQQLNQDTFYESFVRDLDNCLHKVLIESPFITSRRLAMMLTTLEKLKARKVKLRINTRDPAEHDNDYMRTEAYKAVSNLQHRGIYIMFTALHHRKLAVIDRSILYEVSLNILSKNNSCEFMRRIESTKAAWYMMQFVGFYEVVN